MSLIYITGGDRINSVAIFTVLLQLRLLLPEIVL